MISGCANYLASSSAPVIISRSPAQGETGVASNEPIVITFNKKMDQTLGSDPIKIYNQYNTALMPQTMGSSWSNGGKTLTVTHEGDWSGGQGTRVYWIASKEGFSDEDGNFLLEGTVLADYYLSGFGVIYRSPYFSEEAVYHPKTIEVTFSSSVDPTSVLSVAAASEHSAGIFYPQTPSVTFSANYETVYWYIASWDAVGTVALTWENDVSNWEHTATIPAGTYILYYENAN